MSKKLVAGFSVNGVTGKVAPEIAAAESADCFEIRPETPAWTPASAWAARSAKRISGSGRRD